MGRGQFLRLSALVAILAVISYLSLEAANRGDVDEVSTERVVYDQRLTTPMLSARRIPRTVQAPVVDSHLAPALRTIIDGSPATSCVLVQVDGRTIEPTANTGSGLLPASNQKVLTTFGALTVLGPEFRFLTTVEVDGQVVDGVLEGDLYLIGDGDPFLSTENWWSQYEDVNGRANTDLEDLADDVAALGITSIAGGLIGDESLYDELRQGPWAERLIAGKQSGPLSALTVNEGFVDWPAVYPESSRQRNETDNPPLHAVSVFGQLLQERGIGITSTGVGIAPTSARVVAELESPPLTEVITHVNSYSSNIGAELLLKRIGLMGRGVGSTVAGADALLDVLAQAGVPIEGVVIADGSGLSESNRISCQAIAAVLAEEGPDSAFARSLAIGATRGSLLNRFEATQAAGSVYAKTGTLNDATALSGFVRSADEPDVWITFAYVANEELVIANEEVRDLQDPFVVSLTAYPGLPTIESISPLPSVAN